MDKNEKLKRELARQKATGYAAQKKYRETHPNAERERSAKRRIDSRTIAIRIKREYEPVLDEIVSSTGRTMTDIFISAVEEKYGVVLHKSIDNSQK